MNFGRISIRSMILAIVAIALGLAAITSGSETWAFAIRDLMVFGLTAAVGGAFFDRGPRRAFWAGLAIFDWQRLALPAALPWLEGGLFQDIAHAIAVRAHPYVLMAAPNGIDRAVFFDTASKMYAIDLRGKTNHAQSVVSYFLTMLYATAGGLALRAIATRASRPDPGVPPPGA